ncbi:PAS domain-containing protein [Ktedonospora formicarum]|uniref:PAS fold-3 domain-containing protein n=1 Tax=Ktedonospora formicarum TaxID=2778364 RepID=A0A8J3I6G5_9CHLR|nr:PAS domain-containing protein [Ktedonospora formicarum]GHO51227.1 hypothetical protein KSX_93900 [Ktedonospora formicarum]
MTPTIGKANQLEIKEDYRALLDALPHFVWLMQPDGSLVYANQCWRDYHHPLARHVGEQMGVPHQQLDDCPGVQNRQLPPHTNSLPEQEIWLQNFHPEDKERIRALWRQAVAMGEPFAFEYRLGDERTNTYRWFLAQHAPCAMKLGRLSCG